MSTPTSIARAGALLLAALVLALTLDAPRDAEAFPPLADGFIDTVAGTGTEGFSGDNGPATEAQLNFPLGVATDAAGNLYIADDDNNRIRRVHAVTNVITTVAGDGTRLYVACPHGFGDCFGFRHNVGDGFPSDGGPATNAQLAFPRGVAVDAAGNLFIADRDNHRIRRVDAMTNVITTVAGTGTEGFSGDNGPATEAQLYFPSRVAVDAAGNLFIADTFNDRVRRVDAVTNVITTVAGTGTEGFGGDNGPATEALLNSPLGVAVDAAGNLFIADEDNHRIRRVHAVTNVITTVAGTGTEGFGGDGGPATDAQLDNPVDIALDAAGNLFIADTFNDRVRRVDAVTNVITTVAGGGSAGVGDGGPATDAQLGHPRGVAVDAAGNLFITVGLHRIRRVAGVAAIPPPPEERVPFTPAPASSGGTLTAYPGGSLQQLIEDLQAAGQSSATVTLDGTRVTLVVTTQGFVNEAFAAAFPGGVPAGTLMFVRALE